MKLLVVMLALAGSSFASPLAEGDYSDDYGDEHTLTTYTTVTTCPITSTYTDDGT